MMKKKTISPKTPRRKTSPHVRPQSPRKLRENIPAPAGALWDDDRAFRILVKNSSDVFAFLDSRGKILYRSPSIRRVGRTSEEKVLRTKFLDWIWPEDLEEAQKLFARILKSPGKTLPFQTRFRDEDGKPNWVEGFSTNYLDNPAVGAILVNYHDVTDRKQQELALQENERRYRGLFENAPLAIFQTTLDGKVLGVNPEFARMFGYSSPEDVVSSLRNASDVFADPARRSEIICLLTEKPRRSTFENLYRRKDGSTFWGLVNVHTVSDDAGRPLHFEGFIKDIDEEKQAEQALRESAETFRSIFENSSAGVALIGLDRRYRMVNPAYCEIFGYTEEEFTKSDFIDLTHPEDVDRSRMLMQDVLDGKGKNVRFAKRYIHKDGHTIWAEVGAALVHDIGGKPSHFVTHILDISERRRTEEALRESEHKASAMVASAPYGITFVDAAGIITYANPIAEGILGLQRTRIAGRKYDDPRWKITAPDGSPFPADQLPFARVRSTGQAVYDVEHAIQRENGERIIMSVNGAPLFTPDGALSGMVATILDITKRKQAEEALRESEEKYRLLSELSPDSIALYQEGRIIFANPAAARLLGADSPDTLIGRPMLDFVHPDYRRLVIERSQQQERDGLPVPVAEEKFVRLDGTAIDVEVLAAPVQYQGKKAHLVIVRDISERSRAEAQLHALASRHEALLEAIPEIVMEVDNKKIYIWANPAGTAFFGEDVIGKEADSFFEGEQNVYATVQPLFHGSEATIYVESWQRRKDGEKRLLAWWCRTLKNGKGEVTGALSSARDITEQRRADEQIQNLSRFPTENPNPVMRISPEGVLLFANNASRPFLSMWRISVGEPLPEDSRALIGDVYLTNAIREIEIPCGERVFTCSFAPVQKAGYVNLYGRDITERKRAEEALARQAGELRERNADLARLNELTERRMQRLIAMRAIDTAITSSFKLELVLNILLGQLTDLLGVHAAGILIFLPDLQTFRFACGRGFRNSTPEQTYIRKAGSYANQAAQERRTIKVSRLEEHADSARIYPKTAGEDFSAYLCIPLMSKGMVKGVLEIFQRAALDLAPEEETFLETVAGQAAIAIDNAELFEGLQASNDELTLAYTDTLTGWARTLELRNRETTGEAQRLAEITVRLARSLGANEGELVLMYRGAILHDIGMMGIPDSILLKPQTLTEEERTVMRKHPQYAYDLLASINYLRSAIDIPFCHHERYDGSGYPRGLKGDQIPLAARIFAVVDVWDALRSRRAYRAPWTDAEAREYIRRNSGTLFDPKAAQVFLEVLSGP
jgi:PAS domain S-box-containing protein